MRLMALAVAVAGLAACEPRPGKVREQWDQSNGGFTVRTQILDEARAAHMFDRSCHVALLSAAQDGQFRVFARAYFSRCDQNLKGRVQFLNDRVAFVFAQWWYAVSTDGGRRWSIYDVASHLAGRVHYHPRLIESVEMAFDGTGTMTLNAEGVANKQAMTLRTEDFGVTWAPRP